MGYLYRCQIMFYFFHVSHLILGRLATVRFQEKFCLKVKRCYRSFLFVFFLGSLPVLADESSTEAGTVCIENCTPSVLSSNGQELFNQAFSSCPHFLIERFKNKDKKSMWISSVSADKDCSKVRLSEREDFKTSKDFENYLKNKEPFSRLSPPFAVSSCLGVLSEDNRKPFLADYYNSAYRLESGLSQILSNISSIDSLLGDKRAADIDCTKLNSSKTAFKRCQELKACSVQRGSENKVLHKTAEDTLLALKGIKAIDREIDLLKGRKRKKTRHSKSSSDMQDEIKSLEQRKKNIQSLYPWIVGKKFKDGYEENKNYTREEMAHLVRTQLSHTREKLTENLAETNKVYACVVHNLECGDLSEKRINTSLAKTPPLDKENVFGIKNISGRELTELNSAQKREFRKNLTAGGYFEEAQCREKIREDVAYVRKELKIFALDAGVAVATVGLAGAALTGRLAVKMGSRFAPNMTKAQRLQNLSLMGLDVGYSALYADEVMDQCGEDVNKLEKLAVDETSTNVFCENQQSRVKHTSDLRGCILTAGLLSLPVALPAAGLGVRAVVQKAGKEKSTLAKRKEMKELSRERLGKSLAVSSANRRLSKNELEKKLKEAHQQLRQIKKKEADLKSQGYSANITAGVDESLRLNFIADTLRYLNVDPTKTHIPFFADQAEDHIAFMKKGLSKKDKQYKEKIEALDKHWLEIEERIKNKSLTYDYWIDWNHHLVAVFMNPKAHRQGVLQFRKLKKSYRLDPSLDLIRTALKSFPNAIYLPTTREMSSMALNSAFSSQVFPVGIVNKITPVDGANFNPVRFFEHDINHGTGAQYLEETTDFSFTDIRKIYKTIEEMKLSVEKRQMAETAYFNRFHEANDAHDINFKVDEKDHVHLVDDFMNSKDLGAILPDSVDISNRKEVVNYLTESQKIFKQVLKKASLEEARHGL